MNPWKNILHLITALIPVGLIVSALTPSVITLETTGPGHQIPSNIFRRADLATATPAPAHLGDPLAPYEHLPPISERCRRRLLCELHSDKNYSSQLQPSPTRRVRQCHRIRCEDPQALSTTLSWLLSRHQFEDQFTLH